MPTALIVLVFVSFIPYVLAAAGGYVKIKQLGRLDNHHPRVQANDLVGSGARVIAAQSNAWEALALYSATILAAFASGVAWSDLALPSLVFGFTRLAHPILYIANIATARSLIVIVGVSSCGYMVSLAF
ncbi:TPA: MAPEG family protein [Vibrio vulnificus]|uniref:MAPEG family protein n=1 Tax=Vibrio vulnificus TaxID=672 RepID=UPI001A34004F|nr:MAPEG family protein [Vibrio vulnificus]EHK9576953.1 MAPEG family protein [Vibrio parahaemolyticus]EGR0063588.1 MAPEG family protein [Vibrio vulnificus]EHK9581665.1 MAPEG family protein [Vibrio parahaemolyticus]EIZ1900265.1 MAPEG family protein [Vibrio parahaemolyticus]MCA3958005.1 MAPEG family protein [Vibrio vulnificus]